MIYFSLDKSKLFFRYYTGPLLRASIKQFMNSALSVKKAHLFQFILSLILALPAWIRRGFKPGPKVLQILNNTRCAASCRGCVFQSFLKSEEWLNPQEMYEIYRQASLLGIGNIYLLGADLFKKRDPLKMLSGMRNSQSLLFYLFTEGTELEERFLKEIQRAGNIIPIISLDGYGAESDHRKFSGSYEKILHVFDRMKRLGIIYGISTMVTHRNWNYLLDKSYFRSLIKFNPGFVVLQPFTCLTSENELQEISAKMREQLFYTGLEFMKEKNSYPIFDIYGMERWISSCPAGQHSVAIFHTGHVSPCFLIPAGSGNIRKQSLKRILREDPFMKAFRDQRKRRFKENNPPRCFVLDEPEELKKILSKVEVTSVASFFPAVLDETHHG